MTSKDESLRSFPRLETHRLVLREISLADAQAILHNFSDEEVTKWFFPHPFTEMHQAEQIIREFRDKFDAGQGITWGICLQGESLVIGTCGFEHFEQGDAGEIGFDLAKDWWGQGLMHEALHAILTYGFEHLALRRIEADTYCTNLRSIALLAGLGFQVHSVENDSCVYTLERESWQIDPKASSR